MSNFKAKLNQMDKLYLLLERAARWRNTPDLNLLLWTMVGSIKQKQVTHNYKTFPKITNLTFNKCL